MNSVPDSSVCPYVPGSGEPCADCPRLISALYRCAFLQEGLAEDAPDAAEILEGDSTPAESETRL